jgi:putative effector of murein hydrolase
MTALLSSPVTGIFLTLAAYLAGILICRKIRFPLFSPLIVAVTIVLLTLIWTPLSIAQYQAGGNYIAFFIESATVILALNVYRQKDLLRKNIVPLIAGCAAGTLTSISAVTLLCRLLSIDRLLAFSLMPKSVTTAIAIELSRINGGIPSITIAGVIITVNTAAQLGPFLIKALKLNDRVARGCAMGTSGHAIATAQALRMGEEEGAMSGISLCLSGIITSVLFLYLPLAD